MKAMILAAGKGTRARPLTYTIPKPLIPIIGKPLMEILINLLRQHGFDQIMVNVGHLAHEIEGYFRDGQQHHVNIAYSFEGKFSDGRLIGEALGTAGGIKKIQEFNYFFDDTFVVLCGDGLIDIDLTEVVKWHRSMGAIATVITKTIEKEDVTRYGVVSKDENNRVVEFQVKPSHEEALTNEVDIGVYIFEPEIFDFIPPNKEYYLDRDLFSKLIEIQAPFYALQIDDCQWFDIGRSPSYWKAIRYALLGEIKNFKIPEIEVKPGIYTGLNICANWNKVNIQGPVYELAQNGV